MNTVQSLQVVHRLLVEVVKQRKVPKKNEGWLEYLGELIELITAWINFIHEVINSINSKNSTLNSRKKQFSQFIQ